MSMTAHFKLSLTSRSLQEKYYLHGSVVYVLYHSETQKHKPVLLLDGPVSINQSDQSYAADITKHS